MLDLSSLNVKTFQKIAVIFFYLVMLTLALVNLQINNYPVGYCIASKIFIHFFFIFRSLSHIEEGSPEEILIVGPNPGEGEVVLELVQQFQQFETNGSPPQNGYADLS
jgi:hypothetical protein